MGVGVSISLIAYLAALISGGVGIPSDDGSKDDNAIYTMAAFACISLIVSLIFIFVERKKEDNSTGVHSGLIFGDIVLITTMILSRVKSDGREFRLVYCILLAVSFILFVLVISFCAIFLRPQAERRSPRLSQMMQPQQPMMPQMMQQ